ncbi:hypothetical protein EAH88_11770 [Rhodanobacter glycinis]|uniref:Uncharacterized protein n=1 Tax=Rhodanobacter glycinis TaxID=582702 RepID=A0A502C6N2_9GAMM|nr:hypothetical protein [Rhodanobacter glycinis]TPG08304.1 hypothetical protein EAH88_11770 [Rhodanobacter glycinis]
MTEQNEPALVIQARPMISVTLNPYDEIEVATSQIDASFEGVEHNTVMIPLSDVREVAKTMLALLKKRGG